MIWMIIKKRVQTHSQLHSTGLEAPTTLQYHGRVLHKPTALMMSSENDLMAVPMSSMLIEYLRVLKQASSKC